MRKVLLLIFLTCIQENNATFVWYKDTTRENMSAETSVGPPLTVQSKIHCIHICGTNSNGVAVFYNNNNYIRTCKCSFTQTRPLNRLTQELGTVHWVKSMEQGGRSLVIELWNGRIKISSSLFPQDPVKEICEIDGYITIMENLCVKAFDTALTYDKAGVHCVSDNGRLVRPDTQQKIAKLRTYMVTVTENMEEKMKSQRSRRVVEEDREVFLDKQNSNFEHTENKPQKLDKPTAMTDDHTCDLVIQIIQKRMVPGETEVKDIPMKQKPTVPGETEVNRLKNIHLLSGDNSDSLDKKNQYSQACQGQTYPNTKEQENWDSMDQKDLDSMDQKDPDSMDQKDPDSMDQKDPDSMDQKDPDSMDQKHPDSMPIYRKTMRNESSTTGSMRQENRIRSHGKKKIFSMKKLLFLIRGIMPHGIHGIMAMLLLMFLKGSTAYSQTNTTNELTLEIQDKFLRLSFETLDSCVWFRKNCDLKDDKYLANGDVSFNDKFSVEFRSGTCVLVFKNTTTDDLQNYCYYATNNEKSSACKNINPSVHTYIKEWSPWSSCSKTCGGGSKKRTGICKKDLCLGYLLEYDTCNANKCPTDGSNSAAPVKCNAISLAIAIIITIIVYFAC